MLTKMFATAAVLYALTVSPASLCGQEKEPPSNPPVTAPAPPSAVAPADGEAPVDPGKSAVDTGVAALGDAAAAARRAYYVYPRNYAKNYNRPNYRYNRVPTYYYYGGGYPRGYPLGQGGVDLNSGNSSLNYGNSFWNYGNSWLNYGNSW
jgi:hypothetical protein